MSIFIIIIAVLLFLLILLNPKLDYTTQDEYILWFGFPSTRKFINLSQLLN